MIFSMQLWIKSNSFMKNRPRLSRAKTWLLLTLIAWFGIWYYSSDILKWSRQAKAPAFMLSAIDLMREYEANEIAADLKYRGKVVILDGTVKLRGMDVLDKIYVTYDLGNLVSSVQCYFDASQAHRISNVALGQYIRIKGVVDRKMINVMVRDCNIVE